MPSGLVSFFSSKSRSSAGSVGHIADVRTVGFQYSSDGPRDAEGTQTVILVSDSQNRAGGVLRDWFRTLLLPKDF